MSIDLSSFINQEEKVMSFNGEIAKEKVLIDNEEFEIVSPVVYNGSIYKIDGYYEINLNVIFEYKTRCARCLKETVKKLETSFDGKLIEEGSNEEVLEDENIVYYKEDNLDIDKYVLMELSSSLPMKTLCSDECKGICPSCGTDLNKNECDCIEDNTDPRFAKLKDLFVEE